MTAPRFQKPREDCLLFIGTYVLEDLIYKRACPFDEIVTQAEIDEGHFSHVAYDLERAPDCEVELMRVRAYSTPADYRAGKAAAISPGLQEVFSQYIQDDKARWRDASNWLDAMGEPIKIKRAA